MAAQSNLADRALATGATHLAPARDRRHAERAGRRPVLPRVWKRRRGDGLHLDGGGEGDRLLHGGEEEE
jgi:hypothetical protein